MENPASLTPIIALPNIALFSNPVFLANPVSWVAVKSRIPLTFPESRTVLWSNPGSQDDSSRPVES